MLDRMTGHKYVWSEPDQNELLAIASQCPLSGGDAVFAARALLGEKAGFPVWDDIKACPDEAENLVSGADNPDDTGISVFPNPAMDWVNIYITSTERKETGGIAEVNITDISGHTIQSFRFSSDQLFMHLELPSLSPGIYLLRVSRAGEKPLVSKLAIFQR